MQDQPKIGQLIPNEQNRDAIHIAIAPVTAAEQLNPGQHVGFINNDNILVGPSNNNLGIIDPFLTEPVQPGQQCYLFLYPNTVTSLRHEWTHPAFEQNDSKKWLEAFAKEAGCSYEELMEVGVKALKDNKNNALSINQSEEWLRNFAQGIKHWYGDGGPYSYEEVLQIGEDALKSNRAHVGTDDVQDQFNEVKAEFLKHIANVIGWKGDIEEAVENVYFSCAC